MSTEEHDPLNSTARSSRARSHSPVVRRSNDANFSFVGAVDVGSVRLAGKGSLGNTSFAPVSPGAGISGAGAQFSGVFAHEEGEEDDDEFLSRTARDIQRQMRALKMQSFIGSPLSRNASIALPQYPPGLKDPQTINAGQIFAIMEKKKKNLCEGKVLPGHDISAVDVQENLELLEKGGHLFSFTCHEASALTEYERKMLETGVNLSSFADETEYGVPILDMQDETQVKQYTYILGKSVYILPGTTVSDMTPKLISSYQFQKACQPATGHLDQDCKEENTFRMSKTIVRFIFSLTMQFKVSRIADAVLPHFSSMVGVPVHGALLLERTRRTKTSKPDSTAKVKSILLYTSIKGGILVHNFTLLVQSSLPGVVAGLINSFGSMGEAEVGETARNTRKYMREKFSK